MRDSTQYVDIKLTPYDYLGFTVDLGTLGCQIHNLGHPYFGFSSISSQCLYSISKIKSISVITTIIATTILPLPWYQNPSPTPRVVKITKSITDYLSLQILI